MTDENPFDDLDDLDDEQTTNDTADPDVATDDSDSDGVGEDEQDTEQPAKDTPAFPFDEDAIRHYLYARPDTWERFVDVTFDAERELRRTHDIRGVPKREIHNAAMKALLEDADPERIAAYVVAERTDRDVDDVLDELDSEDTDD